ncbi:phospholipase/Carboxylesterase [Colletotrichum sojae]|uniref:Phospholipase/Carboxylesterase n=1 Tax=Colletotrichum sojae TaxID=2175907 RepID=A0A8H6IXJ6_9PEZI|nr:phospholipase/Carboxylesterase [Colletotrichum sojae]
MNEMQPTHYVEPREAHTHTVIFLHGRDSICDEFADDFFESEASEPAEQLVRRLVASGSRGLHGLAGLLGVCSWMPPATVIRKLAGEDSPVHGKVHGRQKPILTPVFLAHANDEEVIDIKLGRQLRELDESGHAAVSDSAAALWLEREGLLSPLESMTQLALG